MSLFAATTPLSLSRDTSDDSSSGQSPLPPPPLSSTKRTPAPQPPPPENSQRKPRGRPPGSKNKPKPPVFITRESDASLKPAILEISAGSDIIHSIMQFATKNHLGVTILSATGTVSDITLRHPNAHAPLLSFHGPFNLLGLSGTFLGPSGCGFGVSLSGGQGQVFGGIVAGKVVAASQVVVVAATFMNPTVHRVPPGEEEEDGDDDVESMNAYGNVANPNPINCQISTDAGHWPPPHY